MVSPRGAWSCARCGTLNIAAIRSCRRCARPRPIPLRGTDDEPGGAPGLAAILSGLLPGLGQLYQERWVRGTIVFLLPVLAIAIGGAFVATFDPLTSLVVRYAAVVTVATIGGLLLYHLWAVADAFASGFRRGGSLRGKLVKDYLALGLVALALSGTYGAVYRGASAWAGLAAKVFAPVAGTVRGGGSGAPWSPPLWTGDSRLNVLVLGLDVRGTGSDDRNTDTMLVLSLDPLNHTATMLSVPRDILVPFPGHRQDKINAAYAVGGPPLSVKLVEDLLGIRIHSYALVDFGAFTKIVDSVGGAFVDVKRPILDEAYPTPDYGVERLAILPGPQLMPGDVALKYARSRHDSNDFSRARRQQEIISSLRLRLAEGGVLARVPAVVDEVGSAVETDLDPANILPLAGASSGIDSTRIRSEVLLPCGGYGPHCELQEDNSPLGYYLIPDRAKIANLVAELFYDPKVRAEGARVEVRAAGSKNGTAQDVADRLEARAFGISRVSTGGTARSAIVVRNQAKRYTADQLRQQLGDLPVRDATPADDGSADIVVLIGSDFRGLATDLAR